MSKLTIQLRKYASCAGEKMTVDVPDVFELINAVEEYELIRDELSHMKLTMESYRRSSNDHHRLMSKLKGLPRYMYNRIHGMQKTPVGIYVLADDIEEEVLHSDT